MADSSAANSDSDFIPAMKFARREGAQLFLVTLGHGIKDGMREHADLVIDTPHESHPFDISPSKCVFTRASDHRDLTSM